MIRHHLFGAAHIDRIGTLGGATVLGASNPGKFSETVGGAALNVASLLAALGAQVSLSSVVGNDPAGDHVRAVANARGVVFHAAAGAATLPTATYTGLLDQAGDLIIALADMEIYASVQAGSLQSGPDDWLLFDANLPPSVIAAGLERPAGHRAAMTVSAAKAPRLRPHLHRLDLLLTNRAEAAALLDAPVSGGGLALAQSLGACGCPRAVLSDGAQPVTVLEDGHCFSLPVPFAAVKDVTGAGDALAAGTLFALGKGAPLADAVHVGLAAARAIVAHTGPYRADLSDVIGDTF